MQERKPRLLDAESLWAYALRILGGRAHSTGELREKLRRRAALAADVDVVIARLKDANYLDDQRFAEGFANARLSGRGIGQRRVMNDLRQRRVTSAMAQRTVEKVYQGVDEEALIEEWVRRKYRMALREGLFREDKDWAAAYRRLVHAGFQSAAIVKVLKRFSKNPELLDRIEPPEPPGEVEE
jgi:regulatory protein